MYMYMYMSIGPCLYSYIHRYSVYRYMYIGPCLYSYIHVHRYMYIGTCTLSTPLLKWQLRIM